MVANVINEHLNDHAIMIYFIKILGAVGTFFLLGLFLFVEKDSGQIQSSPLIILDTDISSDVDDIGAVAVLHALANQGKAKIVATMVSSGDPWAALCLDSLNSWFGRPGIPVGTIKANAVQDTSEYTQTIATDYPRTLKTLEDVPGAVSLYRRVLTKQEDNSITLVTVGYLTNLSRLLQSQPDDVSPLDGKALVQRKVKKLVCMGGTYPEGREWNFYKDIRSTDYVLKQWPTPIIFCGFEVGQHVETGAALSVLPDQNPVRLSYLLYNDLTDRPSWDQMTVLYAVEGTGGQSGIAWKLSPLGKNVFSPKGENRWVADHKALNRYLNVKTSTAKSAEIIDQLMLESVSR